MAERRTPFDFGLTSIGAKEIPVVGGRLVTKAEQDLGVIKDVKRTILADGKHSYRVTLEDNRVFIILMTEEDAKTAARKIPQPIAEKWWEQPGIRTPMVASEVKEKLAREAYYGELLAAQITKDHFPHSTAEPNPDMLKGDDVALHKLYEQHLPEYNHSGSSAPISPDKIDYLENDKQDSGHKLHLNVAAQDVAAVAEYLKRQGYRHKYLSGGEISDGKVFTVYIGSKDLTDKLAQEISRDLAPHLKRPVFSDEVEYAPNVVGRFDGGTLRDFEKYGHGIRGINMLRSDVELVVNRMLTNNFDHKRTSKDDLDTAIPGGFLGAFKRSFERLAKDYGPFFYGSGVTKTGT